MILASGFINFVIKSKDPPAFVLARTRPGRRLSGAFAAFFARFIFWPYGLCASGYPFHWAMFVAARCLAPLLPPTKQNCLGPRSVQSQQPQNRYFRHVKDRTMDAGKLFSCATADPKPTLRYVLICAKPTDVLSRRTRSGQPSRRHRRASISSWRS